MANSKLRTLAKTIGMIAGTLVVIGGAGAAVTFGSEALANRAADVPVPEAAAITPVSVQTITMETAYTTQRRFLGQIEPVTEASLSFELSGQLTALLVEEGDAVDQGDIIARLDTSLLNAERQRLSASQDALRAQLTFAESRLARAQSLQT